jgi:UTP-glucose-1-phosphate uridylyltransferase
MLFFNANFICYYFYPTKKREEPKNENVYAYNFKGKRYDTGNKLGYLKAMVEFALRREDIGPGFREYLKTLEL